MERRLHCVASDVSPSRSRGASALTLVSEAGRQITLFHSEKQRSRTARYRPPTTTMTDPSQPDPPAGPLAGLRVLDLATVLAGPLAGQILGDYGAEVIKIEHPTQGRQPARSRGSEGRTRAVVEDGGPQQAVHRSLPGRPGRGRPLPAAGRDRRRADRELPTRDARALGTGPRSPPRAATRAGDLPGDRLRPDRPLRRTAGVRHPDGGDERLRAHHRRGRRAADPSAVRSGRLHLRDGDGQRGPDGPAANATAVAAARSST